MVSAIAFELFHNFALIHDDIEDESLLRRGEPTLHRKYGTALAKLRRRLALLVARAPA